MDCNCYDENGKDVTRILKTKIRTEFHKKETAERFVDFYRSVLGYEFRIRKEEEL